ncbi:MAG: heme o synthase [Bdellovibrionota bacterium]
MKQFFELTKSGIVVFVLVTGAAGFALSWPPYEAFDFVHLLMTLASLYFFSAGSFALNQAQEVQIDRVMPRTSKRPIPSGKISVFQATFLGLAFVVVGFVLGLLINVQVALLGIATVIMYNLCYTLYWKRKWAFGAVPGAIPGAMPVVIGYAANSTDLFHPEVVHAFLLMFLWQMPHFWSLAIKFKDDYAQGGIPVLPVRLGTDRTLFHMGLYMFAYVAVAIAAPWFTTAYFMYAFIVVPFAFKILYEFFRYYRSGGQSHWLSFFLWTNFSMLIFLIAPVIDKWQRFYSGAV